MTTATARIHADIGQNRLQQGLALWYLSFWLLTGIAPVDRRDWLLENFLVVVFSGLLVSTYRRFPLSDVSYVLITVYLTLHSIGAHYTYAEVDIFKFVRDLFGWQRNNYDKLGHFAQGFVPAIIAREILIRNKVVNGRAWLNLFVISICLAFSALYELFEWAVAAATGSSADNFLGTQGYMWDTQSDMAMALLGAVLALTFLSDLHDRQIPSRKT